MINRIQRSSFLVTFCVCLAVTLLAAIYLVRWGRADPVSTTGVSVLAAVSTAGMVMNAKAMWREQ